ncbi:MAG: type I restriction enzyme S subunit [Colwellia sp.]|jgi:type I restriction enzyme S subunit
MTGRYQVYSEYKELDSPFLDKLPKSWVISPLKVVSNFRQGKFHEAYIHENGEYICVNSRFVSTEGEKLKFCSKNLSPVQHKDILMVMSDLPNGRALAKALYVKKDNNYALNQRVCAITATKINSRFLYYQLNRNDYFLAFDDGCNQTNLSNDVFKNYPVLIPTEEEQKKIVNFLDHEIVKIDILIAKQEELIELLKEKRQAIISHAVTRGLNLDAPMKNSGVEWLGDMPEHWMIKRLKHISPKVGVGLVINPSTYTRDDGLYFIFGGDVKEYRFDLTKTRRISKNDSDNLLLSKLSHGDLVSVRVGCSGITAVVTEELEGANCASVIIIRKGIYDSDWLCAAMNCWVGRQQVELVSYGAAQKQFNVADAVEFKFPYPPIVEQKEIAEFILNSLEKFNKLSDKLIKKIGILKERKTALISAAVTGKIDVRNWQSND